MIELEDLHVGDTVWYGNISFTGSLRTKSGTLEPQKYIVTGISAYRIVICKTLANSNYKWPIYISKYGYGKTLHSSLYKSEEELKEDWNSVVFNELDHLNAITRRAKKKIEEIKKLLEKYE